MRSISKLARLRAAIRDLKAVEEWNGSFVGGEEKEDMWLTRLDDDVCLSGSFQVCRWGTAVMSCNVLNLQWLFKQWATCVEEKRVVVRF